MNRDHGNQVGGGGQARAWLDVPFAEKDEAKAEGARWDAAAKRWYAPRPSMSGLDRWASRPEVPVLLPGEDRSFGTGLFVDLVPSSCWFTNARSCVVPRDWERLRRMVTTRAAAQCEACGQGEDRSAQRWLEVHERWYFDDRRSVQVLRRLICLCTGCHSTTHFGLATIKGRDSEALAHLCSVTGMSTQQARSHVHDSFDLWKQRSRRDWALDLSVLTAGGIAVARPPDRSTRGQVAGDELRRIRRGS